MSEDRTLAVIFAATGRRFRDLPITADVVL